MRPANCPLCLSESTLKEIRIIQLPQMSYDVFKSPQPMGFIIKILSSRVFVHNNKTQIVSGIFLVTVYVVFYLVLKEGSITDLYVFNRSISFPITPLQKNSKHSASVAM